ncbi:MAG: winged helix-turn-helix domain-containing protein [Dysgonomonas sp.]|jgi:hypothetical protein|nr:winged helix-turn-helix domain-containing protein [Prevotella sp.]MDR3057240.1 winged helix-turn-helix domain-containing protein [Prevotella sp.]
MMKNTIGINAGDIWQLLSTKGPLSVRQIGDYTHYRDSAILIAVGWLYRENKVRLIDKNGSLFIELNNVYTENYY